MLLPGCVCDSEEDYQILALEDQADVDEMTDFAL